MLIEDDDAVLEWLKHEWDGRMDWDSNNVPKMSKHGITPAELETIVERDVLFLGRIIPPNEVDWKEDRHIFLGFIYNQKPFAVIFKKNGGSLRPICSRRMRDNERKIYAKSEEKFRIKSAR